MLTATPLYGPQTTGSGQQYIASLRHAAGERFAPYNLRPVAPRPTHTMIPYSEIFSGDGWKKAAQALNISVETRAPSMWETKINTLQNFCKGGIGLLGWLEESFAHAREVDLEEYLRKSLQEWHDYTLLIGFFLLIFLVFIFLMIPRLRKLICAPIDEFISQMRSTNKRHEALNRPRHQAIITQVRKERQAAIAQSRYPTIHRPSVKFVTPKIQRARESFLVPAPRGWRRMTEEELDELAQEQLITEDLMYRSERARAMVNRSSAETISKTPARRRPRHGLEKGGLPAVL